MILPVILLQAEQKRVVISKQIQADEFQTPSADECNFPSASAPIFSDSRAKQNPQRKIDNDSPVQVDSR